MIEVIKRLPTVHGWTDEFTEAHWQLHIERAGVPIPRADIEARAATIVVIPRRPPPRPLNARPLPLPPMRLPCPILPVHSEQVADQSTRPMPTLRRST
jgi:hypothetical protein